MSEDRRRGEDAGEDSGPGAAYMVFVQMEGLLEKLKLLKYESDYCKQSGFKALSRHYFAIQTNPGEQFFSFTSLAAWLLNKAGRAFEQPQEYDDPNATISGILGELRQLGHTVDFSPAKLKSGYGEHCIDVLNKLADAALTQTGWKWSKPQYPEENVDDDEQIVEDEAEVNLQKMEEEMGQNIEDETVDFEDEENLLDLGGLKDRGTKQDDGSKPEEIMVSNTTFAEWKLEVERVLPQLKVTIRTDNKDWRVHVEQMHQHRDGIETALAETRTYLDKLHDEITRTLEKIASREKYINQQLEHHLTEFRALQDQLAETKERYRQGSGGVTDRTRSLAEITEELEKVKQEMEERGSSMTDGAPLVKIKQAMTRIKSEVTQMEIRTGVIEHMLIQAKLKDKSSQQVIGENNEDGFDYKAY